jgi:hypothetical protein
MSFLANLSSEGVAHRQCSMKDIVIYISHGTFHSFIFIFLDHFLLCLDSWEEHGQEGWWILCLLYTHLYDMLRSRLQFRSRLLCKSSCLDSLPADICNKISSELCVCWRWFPGVLLLKPPWSANSFFLHYCCIGSSTAPASMFFVSLTVFYLNISENRAAFYSTFSVWTLSRAPLFSCLWIS